MQMAPRTAEPVDIGGSLLSYRRVSQRKVCTARCDIGR